MWTWTAIDADTKLIVPWLVGNRDGETAHVFISDLKTGLANRVQLTTDGHKAYLQAVEDAFGADIDQNLSPLTHLVHLHATFCAMPSSTHLHGGAVTLESLRFYCTPTSVELH